MNIHKPTSRERLGGESGQSLVLAVIVMFLLVLIAMVFVLVVAKNQGRASRSKDVIAAQYLAEAGINYADQMLRTSEKGADWRPDPDNMGFTWENGVYTPTADLEYLATNHPDFKWLMPYWPTSRPLSEFGITGTNANREAMGPTGGYSSFNTGKGRYLLRVSYNPNPNDLSSKYIKIESIGRIGVVEKNDPTTWDVNRRLKRELTAYKPIGLTDYLRFATNKEKRSGEIPLGAPGFPVYYGYDALTKTLTGAPIRVNGDLKWYCFDDGDSTNPENKGIHLFLRRNSDGTPIDLVEVSGTIEHQGLADYVVGAASTDKVKVTVYEDADMSPATNVVPSDGATTFDTAGGTYRDGSGDVGVGQGARGIKRLEPPIIDSADTPNKVPRYLSLTRDSGEWVTRTGGGTVNSGRYGWGKGLYINNRRDIQRETETLFGGYTPVRDWMRPNNITSPYWHGPFYIPPGVVITLNPYDTDGDGKADMTITRNDLIGNGRAVWTTPNGDPLPGSPSTITIPYPQGDTVYRYVDANGNEQTIEVDGRNGIIYAEGNIRIKGMLPGGKGIFGDEDDGCYDPVQLTVVSGGIIYIEGCILKFRNPVDGPDKGKVDPRCAIALLAKNYVCVNTTQFVSLLSAIGPNTIGSDAGTGEPPFHVLVTPEPATTFAASFMIGPSTAADPFREPATMFFVRHAGQYGPSYINMWLNRQVLGIGGGGPLDPSVYGCGDSRYCEAGTGLGSLAEHKIWEHGVNGFDLTNVLNRNIGYPNFLEIGLDQSTMTRSNYQLSALTIQPLDVRIEAIIYAQNRSFFIIPGNWFNLNTTDIPGKKDRPTGVDERWPYFGQPLDTRIIIDGAVSENLPASVSEVGEWYAKWGPIPETYGSSNVSTAHPGHGLTFLYDNTLGWPVIDNPAGGGRIPVRTDEYGRCLPITPCLPVSESLYYYGEPT